MSFFITHPYTSIRRWCIGFGQYRRGKYPVAGRPLRHAHHHLALWVRDLERMRAFYEMYFAATANPKYLNVGNGFSSYFLTFPGGGPRLELMQRPGIPDSQNDAFAQFSGLIHFAVSVGSKPAVDGLTNRLRADGFFVVGEPRHTGDGYYESVVLDPELNRIELTV